MPPYLFKRYVRPIINSVSQSQLDCNIGGMFVNLFAYADDMILLSPSWRALQNLINILEKCCSGLDIVCNSKKTVRMGFKPRNRHRYILDEFPQFTINSCKLD